MNRLSKAAIAVLLVTLGYLGWQYVPAPLPANWSDTELATIQSLWLGSLPPLPPDVGNAVADDPRAAELGHALFFDTRLSANNAVSCATCHQPGLGFTDQLKVGAGISMVDRNTMALPGAAYSPWYFWDGRKDSMWSQALEPLENPKEHGTDRLQVARLVFNDPDYRQRYTELFGELPDLSDDTRFPAHASPITNPEQQQAWAAMREEDQIAISAVFANTGKALSAYQRKLMPGPAPFDSYAAALKDNAVTADDHALNRDQIAGLKLFIGKAQCVNCHNGPLFTNNSFHNTAVLSAPGALPAAGRSEGLRKAMQDPFNCLGQFSDADPAECQELRFARGGDEMIGAQRTGSLRNLAQSAPYMHAGQITSLADVIEHYNAAEIAVIGHNEAKPLRLRAVEKKQLIAFLDALNGPLATASRWLQAPESKQ
tara:strand:+ start:15822 stop:17105 length:1284 start_codon:yes stop_codon:yes gene_type:complete